MSYDNELHKHKTADTIKWVVVFVLLVALIGAVVGMALKMGGVFDKLEDSNIPVEELSAEEKENVQECLVPGEIYEHGISLVSEAVAASDLGDDGYQTLSATVTSTSGVVVNHEVQWSTAWKNPSSEWANGKEVDDYLSYETFSSDIAPSNLAIKVKCLQGFNEQIVITCTSVENRSKYATCTVEYYKRVSDIAFSMNGSNSGYTLNLKDGLNSYNFLLKDVIYSDIGTKVYDASVDSVDLAISEDFQAAFNKTESRHLNNYGQMIPEYEMTYVPYQLSSLSDVEDGKSFKIDLNLQAEAPDHPSALGSHKEGFQTDFYNVTVSPKVTDAIPSPVIGDVTDDMWLFTFGLLKERLNKISSMDAVFTFTIHIKQNVEGKELTYDVKKAVRYGKCNFDSLKVSAVQLSSGTMMF